MSTVKCKKTLIQKLKMPKIHLERTERQNYIDRPYPNLCSDRIIKNELIADM